jgi:hypothetical protein
MERPARYFRPAFRTTFDILLRQGLKCTLGPPRHALRVGRFHPPPAVGSLCDALSVQRSYDNSVTGHSLQEE